MQKCWGCCKFDAAVLSHELDAGGMHIVDAEHCAEMANFPTSEDD